MTNAQDVFQFWFEELSPKDWFKKSDQLDQLIKDRFATSLTAAKACEFYTWRTGATGRLAEVILLDQFSRNIYRDQPEAFEADSLALALAQEAVALGLDKDLPLIQRAFLYMPYMHSESLVIHDQAVELFSIPGLENNLHFEHRHRDIIERFGRYPHRNAILGRESTAEEIEFLKQPGSGF